MSLNEAVQAAIDEAYDAPLEGWDFTWLDRRAHEVPPPWNYGALVAEAAQGVERALDIDTGGGEFLARLGPMPAIVIATEGHPPNVAVASRTLATVGIPVVRATSAPDNVDQGELSTPSTPLPFATGAFDLVVDRHSSYWPSEVRRVLRPGGQFLTQQRSEAGRGGDSWNDLFNRPAAPVAFDLDFAAEQLRAEGFHIVRAEEAETPMVFEGLAGVIYYLRLVPWAVEGFDPAKDIHSLTRIADRIAADGELRVRGSCMLIDATT